MSDRIDDTSEFYTIERCHILEIYNSPHDRTHSIARARVEPGVTTAWHHLQDTEEVYLITQGQGLMSVGKQNPYVVTVGDRVTIPADTPQRIKNIGEVDLIFRCICRPAFQPGCYIHLE